jgi:DNA-binding MarR family transcriptional regulator
MIDNSLAYLLHKVVSQLDRAADKLLRTHLDMSYKRVIFLLVLKQHGTVSQHELAVALGYSDPAVSTMLLELTKEGFVTTNPSPDHGRIRLVTITPEGSEIMEKARRLLEAEFDQLMVMSGVDAQHYRELTEQISQALAAKAKKE